MGKNRNQHLQVIASRSPTSKRNIYHRSNCIYAARIRKCNQIKMSLEHANEQHYRPCKYCAGLKGDVEAHKKAFKTWEQKYHITFIYHSSTNTLYIRTTLGFWKVYETYKTRQYLLFHRNTYANGMEHNEAISGKFHRQMDVLPTDSLEKMVDYIVSHDKAKAIIMDDYKKLPKRTKQQKKYYMAAERRERKRERKKLDALYASLESSDPSLKEYSFR